MKPEIFYTDTARLKSAEDECQRVLIGLNNLLRTWEATTNFKITTIADLAKIASDPRTVFIEELTKENEKAVPAIKEIFGPRAKIQESMEQIYLPDGFDTIERLCHNLKSTRWQIFKIQNGEVELSDEWHKRQIGKAYFMIDTSIQKKRLEQMRSLCKALMGLEEVLKSDIKSSERSEEAYWRQLASKSYLGVLPTGVKLVPTGKLARLRNDTEMIMELIPDPYFVIHGFCKTYPGLNIPELKPKEYRLAVVKMLDGSEQLTSIEEGDSVPLDPLRQVATKLLPNIFHLVDGKAIDTKKRGKKYPEHALINQE